MKRIVSIVMALTLALTGMQAQERPTVAVVLSGGGAKGVAHISALRAVEEAGIPIDIVCGTSMGALIGALYCIGYTPDELDSLVLNQDWGLLLSDRTDPTRLTLQQRREQNTYAIIRGLSSQAPEMGGLIRGRNLNALFRELCADYLDSISFDSLPIRFACVATDIVTNTEVDFHSGYLVQAMRASMAIPGVFTPVRMGDSVLVDGGLRNNFPADLARRMGADIIIGVSVQDDPHCANDIIDAASIFNQIIDNNCKNKFEENMAMSDVMMRVDVSGYSAASFNTTAIDSLLHRGRREAERHRDELYELGSRLNATPYTTAPRPAPMAVTDSLRAVATRRHAIPSTRRADKPVVRVGFRFDSEEPGALTLSAKMPLHTSLPSDLAANLRLGKQLSGSIEYSLFPHGFTSPTISYTFFRHDLDINSFGRRIYNIKYNQHTIDIAPLNFMIKSITMRGGLRMDYYSHHGYLLSAEAMNIPLNNEMFLSYYFNADLNTENQWYFPTNGTRLHISYAYHTDNLATYNGQVGISDLAAHWRINLPVTERTSLQPMIYGRILMTEDIPYPFVNALGCEWFGHNIEQQMPFVGIGHTEYVERHFVGVQLQAQYLIARNHYLLLRLAAGLHGDEFVDLLTKLDLFGAQLGYSYNTFLGPIDLRLGYSSRTQYPYIYVSLGHCF